MIVLDANAAIAVVSGSCEGTALRSLMLEGERVIVPHLMKYEFVNAVRKYLKGGFIDDAVARRWLDAGVALTNEFVDMEDALAEILSESIRLKHPSYGLAYLVLARRRGATLFTLDRELARACRQCGVNCTKMLRLE